MKMDEDTWKGLRVAELKTAESALLPAALVQLVAAYDQAGLPDMALTILRSSARFGVPRTDVLAGLLRGCRKQRDYAGLDTAVKEALRIAADHVDIRRELALALPVLGQPQVAEQQWAALICAGSMRESDWLECARFAMSGAGAPTLGRVAVEMTGCEAWLDNHLVKYCAVRLLVDRDPDGARLILRDVDPRRIPDGELITDLAIQSWRLGDYAKAEAAADAATAMGDTPPCCRAVLASSRAFSGDCSLLRSASLPMADAWGEAVGERAARTAPNDATWGFIQRSPSGTLAAKPLRLANDSDMVIPEGLVPVATFSVIPESAIPDPYLILCGVDWSWPHVMLQRRSEGDCCHFFVEVHGHMDWMWEEVRHGNGHRGHEHGEGRRECSPEWAEAICELRNEASDEE